MVSWIVGLRSADRSQSRLPGSRPESITFSRLHPYSRITIWNRSATSRTRPPTTTWSLPHSTRRTWSMYENIRNLVSNSNKSNNNSIYMVFATFNTLNLINTWNIIWIENSKYWITASTTTTSSSQNSTPTKSAKILAHDI